MAATPNRSSQIQTLPWVARARGSADRSIGPAVGSAPALVQNVAIDDCALRLRHLFASVAVTPPVDFPIAITAAVLPAAIPIAADSFAGPHVVKRSRAYRAGTIARGCWDDEDCQDESGITQTLAHECVALLLGGRLGGRLKARISRQ